MVETTGGMTPLQLVSDRSHRSIVKVNILQMFKFKSFVFQILSENALHSNE